MPPLLRVWLEGNKERLHPCDRNIFIRCINLLLGKDLRKWRRLPKYLAKESLSAQPPRLNQSKSPTCSGWYILFYVMLLCHLRVSCSIEWLREIWLSLSYLVTQAFGCFHFFFSQRENVPIVFLFSAFRTEKRCFEGWCPAGVCMCVCVCRLIQYVNVGVFFNRSTEIFILSQ